MKDERYKEIMEGLGMPNSQTLLVALEQVANEVEQEVHAKYKHEAEKAFNYYMEEFYDAEDKRKSNQYFIYSGSATAIRVFMKKFGVKL